MTTQRSLVSRLGVQCVYCGFKATTWDHRIPKARGGTNAKGNLVPSCHACNCVKAHYDSGAFKGWLETPEGTRWRRDAPQARSCSEGQRLFAEYDGRKWNFVEYIEPDPPEEPERFKAPPEIKGRDWGTHGWTPEAIAALDPFGDPPEERPPLNPAQLEDIAKLGEAARLAGDQDGADCCDAILFLEARDREEL